MGKRFILNISLCLFLLVNAGCAFFHSHLGLGNQAAQRPSLIATAPGTSAASAGISTQAGSETKAPASTIPLVSSAKRRGNQPESVIYLLKVGDPVVIYLRSLPGVQGGEQSIEGIINENGDVNLPFIDTVHIAGCTTSEAEQKIRKIYLDGKIYKYITVSVVLPGRAYYVRGEVRTAGKFPLYGATTIVQAIATAGGFNEFANPGNVQVVRGEKKFRVNVEDLEKHPERDVELEPGDVIIVGRSIW